MCFWIMLYKFNLDLENGVFRDLRFEILSKLETIEVI